MGEITDALRHARAEQERRGIARDASPEEAARGTPAELSRSPAAEEAPRAEPARPSPPPRGEPAATISTAKAGDWAPRAVLIEPEHGIAVSFRHFAVRVRAVLEGSRSHGLLVTSALRREGKTTAACNLALALASMAAERRVALVDLDLHRPSVARGLGIRPSVGFEQVLEGRAPLAAARISTQIPTLDVYAIAGPRSSAHDMLSSGRIRDLMAALARSYDAVVVDSPPVLLLPDVALIAPHVDHCVAIVRAGSTPRSAFREMLDSLPRDRLIGCFLNDARLPRHSRYGYYHRDPDGDPGSGSPDGEPPIGASRESS